MRLSLNSLSINANNFAVMQIQNEQPEFNPHRGARMEKALRSKNVNFTWLGKQIDYDRNSFYLWFKREELEWSLIRLVIGALPWVADFYPDMPVEINLVTDTQTLGQKEMQMQLIACRTALAEKDKKYADLLEKYIKVIEEKKA
jgi:hypothetical protein